jgi:hypothetical protein
MLELKVLVLEFAITRVDGFATGTLSISISIRV